MRVKRAIEALERRLSHLEQTYIPRRTAAGQPTRYKAAEAAAIRLAIWKLRGDNTKKMTDLASKLHEAAKKNDSNTIVAMLSALAASGDAAGMIAAVKEVATVDTVSSRYIAGHLEVSRDGEAFKVTVRPSGPPI